LQTWYNNFTEEENMYRAIFVVVVLLSNFGSAFAGDAAKQVTPSVKYKEALKVKEFVRWLLKDGKERVLMPGRGASLLDLPEGGVPSKARASGNSNPVHMCSLALDKNSDADKPKPTCFLLYVADLHPEQRNTKAWNFRYRLDGVLEKAVLTDGTLDENGKPVVGSAVDSVQDIKDPEIQAKAKEELEYWLAKAYELTHKTTAKPETAPAASKSE
jgi:hypothetical protein